MKKSSKGAVAAAAAGVLLLGGAGSLAFWSATDTVNGVSVAAGELKLSAATCTGWKFDGSEVTANKAYVPATDKIVPGDVLTQSCDYTITAKGEHLRATLLASQGAAPSDLTPYLTTPFPTLKYKTPGPNSTAVAGDNVGDITESADGSVITAEIKLTFDGSAPNASQTLTGGVDNFTLTFTQVHN